MELQWSVKFNPESTLFISFSVFSSLCVLFHSSTIASPSSHKGTPRLELNNCSFILSVFSLGKIQRYGKDLQLSFRLAITERIFQIPVPIMLLWPRAYHRTGWINHIIHGKLFILVCGPTSSIHLSVHRTRLWVSWGRTTFYSEEPLNVVIRNHSSINFNFKCYLLPILA